jgi:two-component system response regulator YesN
MNIVIVDDEYYARKALSKCIGDSFAACGANDAAILECDSAESALERIETTSIDIVFTDIRMGELDGIYLCEYLHKHYPRIQLVIISGYAEFDYAQKAIQNKVFRYLLKPVDDNEIRNVVQDLLHESMPLPKKDRADGVDPAAAQNPIRQQAGLQEHFATNYLDLISKKLISYYVSDCKIKQIGELVSAFWDSLVVSRKVDDINCCRFLYEVIEHINNAIRNTPELGLPYSKLEVSVFEQLHSIAECKSYFHTYIDNLEDQLSTRKDTQQSLIKQLIHYINENYSEDLNLYDIAQSKFFVHPNYLSKLLKDTTGFSFSKYLLDVRMKQAALLLERKDLPVSIIAQLVGYNSESYFVQVFHRYYGKTPGAYSKDLQKQKP